LVHKENICIHCDHPCHCGMMCSFYKDKKACKCDECNCRSPEWGEPTEYME